MPFELKVRVEFSAAHHLEGYPGDCARPHGHNFWMDVEVLSNRLDSIGLAVDFRDLKRAAKELIGAWDHQDLNTLPDFQSRAPSAEQIAKLAYERLKPLFPGGEAKARLSRVTIWENERSSAAYYEEAP